MNEQGSPLFLNPWKKIDPVVEDDCRGLRRLKNSFLHFLILTGGHLEAGSEGSCLQDKRGVEVIRPLLTFTLFSSYRSIMCKIYLCTKTTCTRLGYNGRKKGSLPASAHMMVEITPSTESSYCTGPFLNITYMLLLWNLPSAPGACLPEVWDVFD